MVTSRTWSLFSIFHERRLDNHTAKQSSSRFVPILELLASASTVVTKTLPSGGEILSPSEVPGSFPRGLS